MLRVRGKHFVVTCTRVLMGVAHCIYGNCFVGKYFVVCFSTMKIPPPPEKYPLYGVFAGSLKPTDTPDIAITIHYSEV